MGALLVQPLFFSSASKMGCGLSDSLLELELTVQLVSESLQITEFRSKIRLKPDCIWKKCYTQKDPSLVHFVVGRIENRTTSRYLRGPLPPIIGFLHMNSKRLHSCRNSQMCAKKSNFVSGQKEVQSVHSKIQSFNLLFMLVPLIVCVPWIFHNRSVSGRLLDFYVASGDDVRTNVQVRWEFGLQTSLHHFFSTIPNICTTYS